MKKLLLATAFVFVSFMIFASEIDSVYGNCVSSSDFTVLPKRGELYQDSDGNIFAVRTSSENFVVFDRIKTGKVVHEGSELYRRNPMVKMLLRASTKTVSADCSLILPVIYPLEPFAEAGYEFGKSIFAMAGFRITCPLSNLVNSNFTLLKDGSICGSGAFGINGSGDFSVSCEICYSHIFKNVIWGLGGRWNACPEQSAAYLVPELHAGVFF